MNRDATDGDSATYFGVIVPRPEVVGSSLVCPIDQHVERYGDGPPSALWRYVQHALVTHNRREASDA